MCENAQLCTDTCVAVNCYQYDLKIEKVQLQLKFRTDFSTRFPLKPATSKGFTFSLYIIYVGELFLALLTHIW